MIYFRSYLYLASQRRSSGCIKIHGWQPGVSESRFTASTTCRAKSRRPSILTQNFRIRNNGTKQ